jgi:ubiquinone biosynthesis protein COQ9
MHEQLRLRLAAEREAIYRWLMDVYKMPSALALAIANQHRVGGELIRWAS